MRYKMTEQYSTDNRPTNVNELSNQLIVLSNIMARKATQWNTLELKLFYTVLSKIKERSPEGIIKLKKADVCDILGIDQQHSNRLRKQFKSMMDKSFVQFDGATEEEWHDGFLVSSVKSRKYDIEIGLTYSFLPLLIELEKHFTSFFLENVSDFNSKYSIILYQNLKSWFDRRAMITCKKYSLVEMKKMFEISDHEYMVKRGKNKDKIVFDTYNFKKYTIDTALKEINGDTIKSGMAIEPVIIIKHRNFVWGYEFRYTLIDKQGRVWQPDEQFSKPDQAAQTKKPEPPEGQTTIDDF